MNTADPQALAAACAAYVNAHEAAEQAAEKARHADEPWTDAAGELHSPPDMAVCNGALYDYRGLTLEHAASTAEEAARLGAALAETAAACARRAACTRDEAHAAHNAYAADFAACTHVVTVAAP